MEAAAKAGRQGAGSAFPVKGDGLADIIHHHLAGVAAGHVFFELRADGRIYRALHVFVQRRKQFRAFHIILFRLR